MIDLKYRKAVLLTSLYFLLTWTPLSSFSQYILNGAATQNSCNCYTLTQAAFTQAGSVWIANKINLNNPFDFSFNVFLGCQDADGVLFPLFHSSSQWAKYSNPSVDAALEAARNSLDSARRMALYRQVLETLHTEIPAVPLYQDVMMFAARKEVKFQPTPNEAFFIFEMKWNG